MGFNFENVVANANKALQGGGEGSYKYKLVYPGVGTLCVKLLFNPKSNSVLRLINRHQIGDDKIPCLKTYGQECPICSMITNIENARAVDLGRMSSKVRGISFAQVVSADYKLPDGVNAGDVVLLMYPWTVYKDISQQISQAKSPQELESLIASNKGFTFNIIRGADNKYTTQINPFNQYQTSQDDNAFMDLLNNMESLKDQILPDPITDTLMKDVNDVTMELQQQYLAPKGPQYVPNPVAQQSTSMTGMLGQMGSFNPNANQQYQQSTPAPAVPTPPTVPNNNPATPNLPWNNPVPQSQPMQQASQNQQNQFAGSMNPPQTAAPTTPAQSQPATQQSFTNPGNSGKPECYGQHGKVDMNRCLLCPQEINCKQSSGN